MAKFKDGDGVKDEKFLVSSVEMKETSKGQPYCNLQLKQSDASISAKIWSNSLNDKVKIEQGKVLVVTSGKIDSYKGRQQIVISSYAISEEEAGEEFTSPLPKDKVEAMINEMFVGTQYDNPDIEKLMAAIYGDPEIMDKFRAGSPSMTNHHNYPGGLVEHTWEAFCTAKFWAKEVFANRVDADIIIAATILHDIGCIYAYQFEGEFLKSTNGRLIDHVYIGATIVEKYALLVGCDEGVSRHVLHCILSHMGNLEWGAVVQPKTLEAQLVHFADMVSARIKGMEQVLENQKLDPLGFTYSYTYGELYRGKD